MSSPTQVESILLTALEKKTAKERAEFLDEACGPDVELRQSVERLLAAYPPTGEHPARPTVEYRGVDPTLPGGDPTVVGPAGEDVTFGFEPVRPGHVLETLARSIGSIPRVLLPDTAPDDAGVAVIQAVLRRDAPARRAR